MLRVLVCAAFFGVSGCQLASDMKEASASADQAPKAIEDRVGGKARVGFRMMNGHLGVNVSFATLPTKQESLAELKEDVRAAVTPLFDKPIESLTVSF